MEYRARLVDSLLTRLLGGVAATLVVGSRAVGKTTSASRLAATTVHLDRPEDSGVFRADPDTALQGLPEPILLDEWQVVPDVLGALKRSVDADSHPGRFLVTGSVRARLRHETWPGTGRMITVRMYGMTVREQLGRLDGLLFLDRLATGVPLALPDDVPTIRDYVRLALRSGFPEALPLDTELRPRWLTSYIEELVTRDAAEIGESRDPARLRRYLAAYGLNTAGVVTDQSLVEAAGVNHTTAGVYERLLTDLFVVEAIPAWFSNRLSRLIRLPKRFIVDAGLWAALINADAGAVLADTNLLGRCLETFVVSQLRAEIESCHSRPRLHHLRDRDGRHEIDILVEYGAERVVGIEVKAAAAVSKNDAKHLRWCRAELGARFIGGVILHTGSRLFQLEEGIVAAPIAALWA
ncbi:MAG: ATP-binding protein [Chloroflexota bacterium]